MGDGLGLSASLELGDRRTEGGLDSGLDEADGGDGSGGATTPHTNMCVDSDIFEDTLSIARNDKGIERCGGCKVMGLILAVVASYNQVEVTYKPVPFFLRRSGELCPADKILASDWYRE